MRDARPIAVTTAILLLAGCAGETGRVAPGDFELTKETRESESWARYLPDLYGGLMACIEAHPAQPAYAVDVVPQNRGMMLVQVVGADNSRQECSIDNQGGGTPRLATATDPARGPMYTPADMPEPFLRCGSNHPVLHEDGKLLGWVTLFRPDCHTAGPAAQQNWRAFGNEPFWNVRVTASDIVFDRLGQLPLRYPSRPPVETSDRWTWQLESPDGEARNELELVILNTPCGDTMADRRYDYRAQITFRGQNMRGCAEKLSPIP